MTDMTSDQVLDPSYCANDIDPADPSFYENTPNVLHCIPHVGYNVHGEYIHAFHTNVFVPILDSAPVPTTTAAAAHVPPAHTVLRPASNTLLSPDPMDDLASNGCAKFDEFTAWCLFENAVEDYLDQDQFFSFLSILVPNPLPSGLMTLNTITRSPSPAALMLPYEATLHLFPLLTCSIFKRPIHIQSMS